jgi:sugar (pentulose or hexulose) kinase
VSEAAMVLDVGKTHAKLSLVDGDGAVIAARNRANATPILSGRRALDADGIWAWFVGAAAELAGLADVRAIVPAAHGAAAALVVGDDLAAPVLDYEATPPDDVFAAYERERGPFAETFSPSLPQGLNLGRQLNWQEALYPEVWPVRANALLWPQYWAWRLCGEKAAEVTSLGCHTDLWRPAAGGYSDLALRRGWADRLGPLRAAGDVLGVVRPDLAARLGLATDCVVLCGVHDSNASLHAVRGAEAVAGGAFSLVSTGTWFVAFQVGGEGLPPLDPARDTLANVAVDGRPVASARFMGGREYAAIVEHAFDAGGSLADARAVIGRGVMATPSFAPGCGPYPNGQGRLIGEPSSAGERAAVAALHLALTTDTCLSLVRSEGPIVLEGRFAADAVFPAALAALRPDQTVLASSGGDGVALGAARLWRPTAARGLDLTPVTPLDVDLVAYADRWREAAAKA